MGTKGEDKASTCFLARLRQEMLLCRACPHGLVSSASLPCRPAPSAGARGVGRLCESASLAAADLGIFCCQIFRFLEKKCSDLLLNNNVRVSCRCSDCRIFSTHLKDNFALFIRFRTLYCTTTHGDEEAFVLSYHTSMMMKDERDQSIDVGGLLVGFHRCPVSHGPYGEARTDGRGAPARVPHQRGRRRVASGMLKICPPGEPRGGADARRSVAQSSPLVHVQRQPAGC